MKQFILSILAVVAWNVASAQFTFDDIEFWIGSGVNRAAMVIDFNDGSSINSFAWGYRFDDSVTGAEMISAIDLADSRLSLNGGSGFGGFLSTVSYNGPEGILSQTGVFNESSWAYYIAGGLADGNYDGDFIQLAGDPNPGEFDPTDVFSGAGTTFPEADFASSPTGAGPGFGSPGRTLVDGSWDYWSFGSSVPPDYIHGGQPSGQPVAAAIPEPSFMVFGLGLIGLILRRRRS